VRLYLKKKKSQNRAGRADQDACPELKPSTEKEKRGITTA
jgi:hypothetical protein